MMIKLMLSSFLIVLLQISNPPRGEVILKKIYSTYAGKWYKELTFVQNTKVYDHDTLKRTAVWHEATVFPDKFRIDLGNSKNGNAAIYRNDSLYNFRKGKLVSSIKDENDLTFLLGGMYFYSFGKVLTKIKHLGYDLSKVCEGVWAGKPVYIIGASSPHEKTNQLWFDKEHLYLVRMFKFDEKEKEESVFSGHIKLGSGWTETEVKFYSNDKLVQEESYKDCQSNSKLDLRLFDPAYFGKVYWFKD